MGVNPAGAMVGLMDTFYEGYMKLARLADYKERTHQNKEPFDYSKCKDPDAGTKDETVTLCGVCLKSNQLGNIMFGIIAVAAGLEKESRQYGRGELDIGIWPLNKAPKPPWVKPGEGYRSHAFELGIDWAKIGKWSLTTFCKGVNGRANALNKDASSKCPCPFRHDGPNTDMNRDPLTDSSGNRK